jgi:hypothetical protein
MGKRFKAEKPRLRFEMTETPSCADILFFKGAKKMEAD